MLTNAERLAGLLIELQHERGYWWDQDTGQYISRWNHQPVNDATVLRAVDQYRSQFIEQNLRNLTQRLIDGRLDLATWQTRVAAELKRGWLLNCAVGRGGWQQLTFSDFGRLGQALRLQYRFLNQFALDIASGRLTAAQIMARAAQYAGSARTGYFMGQSAGKREAGYVAEQRILGATDKHCPQCVDFAGRGRVPLGSLPEPGQDSVCDGNCRCRKIYFREGEQ